jgi:hypothetical protein
LFDPTVLPQDYSAPANQLGPLAQQVMRNPVGTETTSPYASQSVGVPSGPFNPIEAMTSSGQPILGTDMDRARAAVAQGMQEAPAMVLGMVGDAPGGKGFTAYHGSPHSFDAFDTAAIGTGEGAQAYGHGLYFADKEGVARGYRDALAGKPTTSGVHVDGVPAEEAGLSPGAISMAKAHLDGFQTLDQFRASNEASLQRAQEALQRFPNNTVGILNRDMANRSLDALDELKGRQLSFQEPIQPGHMYEVNINAPPEHFLDWDKPLSEQSPQVQQALSANPRVAEAIKYSDNPDDPTGRQIHNAMVSIAARKGGNGDVIASEALRDAGLPGIRYLDAGSRGGGEGTRNTVIFDPATIEILRKYGIAGLMAGGAGAIAETQQPQQ